ncbi:MAG: hypothetical protein RLZZ353_367 [Actinomycetota bacterium]|jgi:hypothetical protein
MDAFVPLLILAVALWARLGRGVRRRDDVGRAVAETVARLRRLAADAGVPTPPRSAPRDAARTVPVASAAPVAPSAPVVAAASVEVAVRATPVERIPPERVVTRPPATGAPAPAAPAAAGTPGRRRRLDVRRDLVAAELLAAPVSLRPGGDPWR